MILPEHIAAWPQEWKDLWAERAAVMEFDGGMTRKEAEKQAEDDIRRLVERNFLDV